MAIGTSAADLMISVIALFVSHSTVGLGTIIGSEIFNHLIISAACAMNSKTKLRLNKRIFTREIVSYGFTLCILMACLNRGSFSANDFDNCLSVSWYIGLILMVFYGIYALLVVYSDRLCGASEEAEEEHKESYPEYIPPVPLDPLSTLNPLYEGLASRSDPRETHADSQDSEVSYNDAKELARDPAEVKSMQRSFAVGTRASNTSRLSIGDLHDMMHAEAVSTLVDQGLDVLPLRNSYTFKKRLTIFAKSVVYYTTYPLRFCIQITIPNLKKKENRGYYMFAGFMSVAWLGLLAQVLLMCIDVLGILLGISPVLMGLTIGAWGASMPTLWSSMVVAKKGYGDMAVSNAIGANVFSVLVGLGIPWFAYPLYINKPYDGIQDSGILPLLVLLLLLLIVYYILVRAYGFVLEFW